MSTEKRNLIIMWSANFLVSASATMIMPFLSLYIETFGDFSEEYVQRWAGFVFGVTFITAFLFSPIWGRIGDKYGYKPILLITGSGIAISIFLMGFMESVMGLFILRFVMGAVTGFIPTSMALIGSQTPRARAGRILGTLQMGTVSGGLLGPLMGGMLADAVGFEYTFIITSLSIALATIFVAVGIKEVRKTEKEKKESIHSAKEVLSFIFHNRVLVTVMAISLIVQVANFTIQPLLALYVNELTHAENIAFLAGLAFSATGFGNLLATRQWGILGDKIGHEKVLLVLLVCASILFIPQGLATHLWQLVLCRFLYGMAVGGIIPCVTAYIRRSVPIHMQGEVLGYNTSCRFLGNVIGPALGGIVSGFLGIAPVFFITSLLLLLGFFLLFWSVRKEKEEDHHSMVHH
ncbi:MAG TPA: MFS transporter [Bacillus sp. (in: firmicutes)]|uniref:MFS transporter n=1 Tax=Bacillus litorisediminis TaxID=2922713 RepID=UPI001FAF89DC|nr:MFS transporter [Bacillus litorisediminis]HWO77201.1 MFS transporter [Bacillus sp. (in: firmicutes)]